MNSGRKVKGRPDGKLVLVTAINPTPAGEGKTTITVGLGEALGKMGKNAIIALREPSLGPCFGIKGGAAGGGYAQVLPMEDLNLHFTGDFHAITSANNLLAALLDNHIQQGNALGIDPRQILWKRCLDMNDRVLRNVVVGLGAKADGMVREDHFVITVASEIMAILCLANDMEDLKRPSWQDHRCLQLCRRACNCSRSSRSWFYGSSVKGCFKAKYDPDLRAYRCFSTRRTICKYRSWL